jgi:hypothetical protein
MLEDLPELDTIEPMDQEEEKTETIRRRFIRSHHSPHPQSGMILASDNDDIPIRAERVQIQQRPAEIIEPPMPTFSCQDIYFHIENCPMCKKFYKPDNTMYLIVILILIIACTLLLKKVLNI